MKLMELTHNHDWHKAFHATKANLREEKYLRVSDNRLAMSSVDDIMIKALPEYSKSIFFSLGWPRATEWSELSSGIQILQYDTEFLLNNFPCILLKNDHLQHRIKYLEYFIDDPKERQEYLNFIQPWRKQNKIPTYADHPLLKKWSKEASNPTVAEYRKFIREQLAVFGVNNIYRYLQSTAPYFEELLVQGKIPLSEATVVE